MCFDTYIYVTATFLLPQNVLSLHFHQNQETDFLIPVDYFSWSFTSEESYGGDYFALGFFHSSCFWDLFMHLVPF